MQVLSYFPELVFLKTGIVKKLCHKNYATFIDVLVFFWSLEKVVWVKKINSLFALFITPHAQLSVNVKVLMSFSGEYTFCCIRRISSRTYENI